MKREKKRCFGEGSELYAAYHDEEWGRPSHDEHHLFEMLILEGAQAGLSWEIILKRRGEYRKAFYDFDPAQVAAMTDRELETLIEHGAIIRNRLKIQAARQNARVFLEVQREHGSFDAYVWRFVDNRPRVKRWKRWTEVPCSSAESEALSKDLKRKGMKFVGPKILYSFMQAVGLIDDHLEDCWCAHRRG